MAFQLNSYKELSEKLQTSLNTPTLLSFIDENESSSNLQEFFSELVTSFPVQILLVAVSNPQTRSLFSHYSVSKVPTTVFLTGFKENSRIEGSNIPELFSKVESVMSSFSADFEAVRNEEFGKLQKIINQSQLVVFMKGTPESPKSTRSLKMRRVLNGYEYSYFDLLTDPGLAEWLKVYSGVKVLPVFFVNGKAMGSVEEIVEMTRTGELFRVLGQELDGRLEKMIKSAKYFVVMMGSKEEPICGFSKRLIAILDGYGIDFDSFDISFDNEVCEGLKKYSNWPTFPQVYVEGELIGGYDICNQMHLDGSLKEALKLN